MLAVIINVGAIIVGTLLGLVFKKLMDQHTRTVVIQAMSVAVIGMGITNMFGTTNWLVLILSLAIGGFVGSKLKIEQSIEKFGDFLQEKYASNPEDKIGQAFVNSTLIFCVGSMVVYGSIEAGLGNYTTLYTKSILDGTASIIFTAAFGWGVALSIVPLFILEGGIVLLAGLLEPIATTEFMAELSGIGGALLVCIGITQLQIKKIHTADMLPALLGTFVVLFI